ncbi:hypothetical protein NC651_035617 [Populus alba x Populus x berolinensis]|nr:hypothetical protein NC651_035617 [Populus alba x Populus x berolinensis]
MGLQVSDRKNCRLSEAKENSQSGKSWAFEFGDELQICPIVVEDLAYPGQILIQACKGFHRLGIFWPLMQLLQRRRNSISSIYLMHPCPVEYEGRLCTSSDELRISELN